jgi:hypothetical protein
MIAWRRSRLCGAPLTASSGREWGRVGRHARTGVPRPRQPLGLRGPASLPVSPTPRTHVVSPSGHVFQTHTRDKISIRNACARISSNPGLCRGSARHESFIR